MAFPVGVDNYRKLVQEYTPFIDKTAWIQQLLDEGAEVSLITRPRRFGKTLNLSMLQHFFAAEVAGEPTRALFDGTAIAQAGEAYMKHQGAYPVIFLSLKSVKASTFAKAEARLMGLLAELYDSHNYLLDSEALLSQHKAHIAAVLSCDFSRPASLERSLKQLTYYLYQHHRVRPWILIDEYDTPIQSAYEHDYYDDMVELFRGWFGEALKSNTYLHRAVLTGILRIAKESLFSDLNHFEVHSCLRHQYAPYFGFTEDEVNGLLKATGLQHCAPEIKRWYNGYRIGAEQLYNPWSIINCLKQEGQCKPYWVNTGGYQLIQRLLIKSSTAAKAQLNTLLQGGHITANVNEYAAFQYLHINAGGETAVNTLWMLLLAAGYLTPRQRDETTQQSSRCDLALPNQEIRSLFADIIRLWLSGDHQDIQGWFEEFLGALLAGDMVLFERHLLTVMQQVMSVHDLRKDNGEAFYHGFMLGVTAQLGGRYEQHSNLESGHGRYDLALIPQDNQGRGVIFEFKYCASAQGLPAAAEAGLLQIEQGAYVSQLQQRAISPILCVAIAFHGKTLALAHREYAQ